jgi:hypothetical protein
MKEADYINNEIEQQLSPTPDAPLIGPTVKAADWLTQNAAAQKPTFDGSVPGAQEGYLTGEHDLKKTIGMNMGRAGGGVVGDPERLFDTVVRGSNVNSPNLIPAVRDIYMEQLQKDPAAWEKFNNERQVVEQNKKLGMTPEMQTLKDGIPQDFQPEFDRRLATERLDALFPQQMDTIKKEQEMARRFEPSAAEASDIGMKAQMIDQIQRNLEGGIINEFQAGAALRALSNTNRVQHSTTGTVEGAAIATALGLNKENRGERYRPGDVLPQADDAARKRMNAIADENWQPGATKELPLADGTKQQLVETGRGKWQQASGTAPEKDKREGGKLYDNPIGWEYKGLDGKVTIYDRGSWNRGSDGKLYGLRLRQGYDFETDGKPTRADFEWDYPQGVTEWGKKGGKQTEKQVGPAASMKFETMQEAEKNSKSIKPGTIVEIGGKRFKWEK